MIKDLLQPSFSRVGPNNRMTLELTKGPTYYRVHFVITAAAGLDVTDIGRIAVMINGNEKIVHKNLQRLIDLNAFYNRAADTVVATRIEFSLHFFRMEMADSVFKRVPGLGTLDVSTLHIEVDAVAAAPADIAIKAYAEINPISEPLGSFVTVREFPGSSTVAGEVEVANLPKGPWYSAIHCAKADISNVKVLVDEGGGSVVIVDLPKQILERKQKNASPIKRVPVTASYTHVDFLALDGNLQDALLTAQLNDFRLKLQLDTSGSYDLIVESYDVIPG